MRVVVEHRNEEILTNSLQCWRRYARMSQANKKKIDFARRYREKVLKIHVLRGLK
jgi:hypothetical protein